MAALIATGLSLLATLLGIVRAKKRRPPLNFFVCALGCVFAFTACLVTQTWMYASAIGYTGFGALLEYALLGVIIFTAGLHGSLAAERSLDATGSKLLGILGFVPVVSLVLAVPFRRTSEDTDKTEPEDDSTPAEDETEAPARKPTMVSTRRAAWITVGLLVYSLALTVINDLPWLFP